jgi:succinyl-diaminopimelate desuccinylase
VTRTDALLSWLGQREEEMAALVAELVSIPTENPPGKHYRACADFLESRVRQLGLACERFEPSGQDKDEDAPACLLARYGGGSRTLYFHGHYDVVPAQSAEQFRPVRKEHFLFGRGACDMKGGIVAMLYAILALKACGEELNGKIGLILVPDEETGGERGSA